MNKILFRTIIILSSLLCIIPLSIWLFSWAWTYRQPYYMADFFLYLITETGSAPFYALIVSILFATTLSLLCKKSHWMLIFLSVFILQSATQVVKSAIKQLYQEPRPYMSYVVSQGIDIQTFYSEPRSERKKTLQTLLDKDTYTPNWLKQHWQNETGYSFPSGHTAFAVCWLLIFVGFLSRERTVIRQTSLVFLTGWTMLMLISRLRLGMHFPVDVLVSIVFVSIINGYFFYLLFNKGWQDKINQWLTNRFKVFIPNKYLPNNEH